MKHVEIFTDGACSGNPGSGGWGAVLHIDSKREELSGGEPYTTNNRMELTGVISALSALEEPLRQGQSLGRGSCLVEPQGCDSGNRKEVESVFRRNGRAVRASVQLDKR